MHSFLGFSAGMGAHRHMHMAHALGFSAGMGAHRHTQAHRHMHMHICPCTFLGFSAGGKKAKLKSLRLESSGRSLWCKT